MSLARFIYDSPGKNIDLYYATGFRAPDPFIFFDVRGKKHIVIKDLEIDRAKKTAKVHKVISLSKLAEQATKNGAKPNQIDILDTLFKQFKIKTLEVPENTPFTFVDQLRKRHYKIIAGQAPFYPSRLQKTTEEKRLMIKSQKTVFEMISLAEKILRACKIKNDYLYYKGKILTSETLRETIHVELMKRNFCTPEGTIVACGKDTTDPHNDGKGPLRAHEAIIIDLYPQSMETLFWGDATRTFCVGKAPEKLKNLYAAVRAGYEYALKNIKAGINGRMIHEGILKIFDERGFKTGEIDGRMQGFFHSTGHGIGLELHESPVRIGPVDFIFKEGMVTSVEPGLYYKNIGGVRIEDLVYVTKNGCEVLAGYPKKLEII